MKVFILQGLPGSGKSTYIDRRWAAQAKEPGNDWEEVVSADHFFIVGGEYRFDPTRLPLAHANCLTRFVDELTNDAPGGPTAVIVDNTNTTVAEVAPYYALAQAYGHDVEILHFPCTPEVAAARNTHGVPLSGCQAMAARLEKFAEQMPPWWRRRTIENNQQEVK